MVSSSPFFMYSAALILPRLNPSSRRQPSDMTYAAKIMPPCFVTRMASPNAWRFSSLLYRWDLILQKPGFEKVDDFSKTLLEYIREHGGRINLNDKSPAEDIYDTFGVSKKTFKKGVGDLYKKRLISLHENGITLAES